MFAMIDVAMIDGLAKSDLVKMKTSKEKLLFLHAFFHSIEELFNEFLVIGI